MISSRTYWLKRADHALATAIKLDRLPEARKAKLASLRNAEACIKLAAAN